MCRIIGKGLSLSTYIFLLCLLVSSFLFCALSQSEISESKGKITFLPNAIESLSIHFVEEFFRFQWMDNIFDLKLLIGYNDTGGIKELSLRDFWEKTDRVVKWTEICKRATRRMYEFGYRIEDIPQEIADNVSFLVWKIEGANFDVNIIEIERIDSLRELGYNLTRFHLPDRLTLSYEDLWQYNFTVSHRNKFETVIKNVQSKTNWNLDPIVFSDDETTVTGYTEEDRCDYNDLYDADLATTRILKNSATYTTDTTTSMGTLYPAEMKGLYIWINLTSASAGGCDITFTGKDIFDSVIVDTVVCTVAGVYQSALVFKSVDVLGVYIDVKPPSPSFTLYIYQTRFGGWWKDNEDGISQDGKLIVGTDAAVGYFGDTCRDVYIMEHAYSFFDKLTELVNGSIIIGEETSNKHGYKGCQYFIEEDYYIYLFYGGNISLYGVTVQRPDSFNFAEWITVGSEDVLAEIYSCKFEGIEIRNSRMDINDVTLIEHTQSNLFGIFQPLNNSIMNDVRLAGFNGGLSVSNGSSFTFSNINAVNFRGDEYLIRAYNIADEYDTFLINVESESWKIYFLGEQPSPVNQSEIFRQYTFDLSVTFDNTSYAEGANVTISNSYLGLSDSWILSSNGSIPQQVYSYGHYNFTGGDTIYNYNPYHVTATLNGYCDYSGNFTLNEEMDLILILHPLPPDWIGLVLLLGLLLCFAVVYALTSR